MKLEIYTLREHIIRIPVPQSFMDVAELVSSDYYRRHERKLSVGGYFCNSLRGICWPGSDSAR